MEPYLPEKLPLAEGVIDWAAQVTLIGKANAALARYDGILQVQALDAILDRPFFPAASLLNVPVYRATPPCGF